MSETQDEIVAILKRANAGEAIVREFASFWLECFQRDAQAILAQQRREGRALAFWGEDTEPVGRPRSVSLLRGSNSWTVSPT
jgi:hypothetical protein